jgi:hypothetical protein
MATETFFLPGYGVVVDAEDGDEVFIPGYGVVANNEAAAAAGRIMSSLAGSGGLAGKGGIAGAGGGLAG